uniref:MgtE domain-containing protein n=1 Tax=Rhabditophanes sp. KR3021 TaxID=114890 RepID=A0AC35TUQ9_9BILA
MKSTSDLNSSKSSTSTEDLNVTSKVSTVSLPLIKTSSRCNNCNTKKLALLSRNISSQTLPVRVSDKTDEAIYVPDALYTEALVRTSISREPTAVEGGHIPPPHGETTAQFVSQACMTYLITGLAFVLSGAFFESHREGIFLSSYKRAVMLAPPLLGLKGNIETTFAARLATVFHCGKLNQHKIVLNYFYGNMALVQLQSVVVSLFAVGLTVVISTIFETSDLNEKTVETTIVLVTSALASTCMCAFILGLILFTFLKYCTKSNINPDNFLTPLSASFGDLLTMIIFLVVGDLLTKYMNAYATYAFKYSLPIIVSITFTIIGIYGGIVASRNESSVSVLKNGWAPIITACFISTFAGYILKSSEIKAPMAQLQPLVCGLLGNRIAVQCSRLSTDLHRLKTPIGTFPNRRTSKWYANPLNTFFSSDFDSKVAVSQVITNIPAQYLFLSLSFVISGTLALSVGFVVAYIVCTFILMIILLYFSNFFVHILWKYKQDPDTVSIPLLTAVTDLSATVVLFFLLGHYQGGFKSVQEIIMITVAPRRFNQTNIE